jgi:transcriptional regulator with XRE-family HTH domain
MVSTICWEVYTVGQVQNEIRRAINESGVSRYAISKATGIDQGQLSKLMSGEVGISLANLEKLLDFLNLEIVIRPNRRRKGKK